MRVLQGTQVVLAPRINRCWAVGYNADGDIEVTFDGILQSATAMEGPFADVPGNPRGTMVVSAALLADPQFFRVR